MKSTLLLLLTAVVYSCNAHLLDDLKRHLVGINGGKDTPIMNHPFQVSITVDNQFVCSGSLIHTNWVLTVASCVKGYDPYYMSVRAGSTKTDSDGTVMTVDSVISHENFTDHNMDSDIALLKLHDSFKEGPKIRTIRLANDPVAVGQPVTVTGWGVNDGEPEKVLTKVSMRIRDLESCKEELTNEVVTPRMVCADNSNKDGPCWGDFGDPMVNQWHALVGLYSFTKECSRYPSIFTDVISFEPWIKNQLSLAGHQLQ